MNPKHLKTSFLLSFIVMMSSVAYSAIPSGYYSAAEGKKQQALLTALKGIIQPSTSDVPSYDGLWNAFKTTDVGSNGKLIDMYSNVEWTPGSKQCGNYSNVGSCYNREHSMPKSWFNEGKPMYSDLFHLYPTDGYVNNQRSNFPFGECANGTRLTNGSYYGKGKLGTSTYSGYTGKVFEPDDEYKGDFARTYFYMAAAYNDKISSWSTSSTNLGGTSYPCFNSWSVTMLMEWHRLDPVSAKEIARNEAVYGIQGNRNPFIDHPEMAEYIWGTNKDDAGGWTSSSSSTPTLSSPSAGSTINVGTTTANTPITKSITIAGSNLTSNITLSLSGTNSTLFALSSNSVTASAANSGTTVTVTYTPTANGTHTATLTLSSSDFSTRTVTLTGTASDSGSGGGDSGSSSSDVYEKITAESQLVAGRKVLFVYESGSKAMGTISNNSGQPTDVTISESTITLTSPSTAHPFTLGGSSGAWTLLDEAENYYLALTSASNAIHTSSSAATWTITYSDETPSISPTGQSTSAYSMKYNTSSKIFRCYKSGQADVAIYQQQADSSEPEPYPTIDIDPTGTIALTATTGSESAAEDVTVTVADNSSDVTVAVSNATYFELSDDDGETWSSSLTLGQYGGGISVRAKAIANAGTYTATLTATAGSVSEQRDLTVTVTAAGGSTLVDEITQSVTKVTKTSYTYWEATGASGTGYAGCVAGNSTNIQMNISTNDSKRGIWTTSSIGNATKVTVTWGQTPSSSDRGLKIYGKSTAYEWTDFAPNSSTMGTLLGELDSSTTTLNITGSYAYIAIYAKGGVVYPSAIGITWSTGGGTTPTLAVAPTTLSFSATEGTASAAQSVAITASNNSSAIGVTLSGTGASAFELSTDQTTWSSTLSGIAATGGTIYARVKASASAGSYTATLTATAGTLTATSELSATVTAQQQSGESTVFEKITSANDLVPGRKIFIVYNDGNSTSQAVYFNGSLSTLDAVNNYFSAYFDNNDNTIINADENDMARTFTLLEGSTSGKYYIKSASGKYIGRTSNSNGFNSADSPSSDYDNTIEFSTDGYGYVTITSSAGPALKFNNANNQMRFRYYATGQQSIYLYQQQGSTTPTPTTLGEAVGTSSIDLPVNIAYVDGNGIAYGCASAGENQITEGNASEKSDNAGTYSDDFTKYDQRDWVAISGLTNPSQYLGKTISGFKGSRDSSKPGYYYVATSQPTSVAAQSGDNNVPANEYQVHNLVASPDDNDYVRPQVYEYTTKFYAALKKENNTWKAFGTSAENVVSILLDTSLFASTTGWVESSGKNYNTLEGIFVTTSGASSSPRLREVDLGSQSYQFLITKAPTTEDIPTGINGIGSDNETMKVRGIYNLQGQRVRATVPGQLYIINGKKTMVNSVIRDTDF